MHELIPYLLYPVIAHTHSGTHTHIYTHIHTLNLTYMHTLTKRLYALFTHPHKPYSFT